MLQHSTSLWVSQQNREDSSPVLYTGSAFPSQLLSVPSCAPRVRCRFDCACSWDMEVRGVAACRGNFQPHFMGGPEILPVVYRGSPSAYARQNKSCHVVEIEIISLDTLPGGTRGDMEQREMAISSWSAIYFGRGLCIWYCTCTVRRGVESRTGLWKSMLIIDLRLLGL